MENSYDITPSEQNSHEEEKKGFHFPELNQVTIAGVLEHDPPIRWTKKGVPVTNFLLRTRPDPCSTVADKIKREECIVSVVVWARQALQAKKYLKKGNAVIITGELQSMPNAKPEEGFYPVQINAQWIQYLDRSMDEIEDLDDDQLSRQIPQEQAEKASHSPIQ